MGFELILIFVMVTFDRGFFDRSVHSFDLSIGPGMIDFGLAVFNLVLITHAVKNVIRSEFLAGLI